MWGDTRAVHTGPMNRRSGTAFGWSAATGVLGVVALLAAALALSVLTAVVDPFASLLGATVVPPPVTIETAAVMGMALCLAVSVGGGWVVAGAADGLVPRWLAGAATGLIGVASGFAVFALATGIVRP